MSHTTLNIVIGFIYYFELRNAMTIYSIYLKLYE